VPLLCPLVPGPGDSDRKGRAAGAVPYQACKATLSQGVSMKDLLPENTRIVTDETLADLLKPLGVMDFFSLAWGKNR